MNEYIYSIVSVYVCMYARKLGTYTICLLNL
jgi:hypothetical protein